MYTMFYHGEELLMGWAIAFLGGVAILIAVVWGLVRRFRERGPK